MKHLDIIKNKEEKRKCTTCDKVYTDISSLKKHIKAVHEVNSFSCDQCSKKCC